MGLAQLVVEDDARASPRHKAVKVFFCSSSSILIAMPIQRSEVQTKLSTTWRSRVSQRFPRNKCHDSFPRNKEE